ncbi:DUF5687 family protein [Ekhidna sp.]
MDLFYVRHHYQSIVRSPSFDGEIFAFVILGILFGSSVSYTYSSLESYAIYVSEFFGKEEVKYDLLLMIYIFLDLSIRLVFRRPLPKLRYYILWSNKSKQIASQYLFTSLFGIVPFVIAITMLMITAKAGEWLGGAAMLSIVLWWLANHFIGLIAQFANRWFKSSVVGVVVLILVLTAFIPEFSVSGVVVSPLTALMILILAITGAYYVTQSAIVKRDVYQENKKPGLLDSLPVLSFKNPIIQLEWALLARNKRTRSNLLFGLISVLILPFLIDSDNDAGMIDTLVFFIITGFFIIQHGVYSLGWEGSYFDFLITNISPKVFIKTRYLFYAGACLIGLMLALIPTAINGLNWLDLFMVFLYNIGITIPLVLYRSTLNNTKIVLTENSFMNYNGMMTGPIFVSSFLVMLIPLFIYGIAQVFLGNNAIWVLGFIGVMGLILFPQITNLIAKRYQNKKYHLSQSFKA